MTDCGVVRSFHDRTRAVGAALLGLFVLAASAAPTALAAQTAGAPSRDGGFSVSAAFGVLTPLANLTDDPESFGTVITPYLAAGVEAIVWTSSRFGIGVVGLYSPSDLDGVGTQFQGATPDDLGAADYFAGAVNLIYRIRSPGSGGAVEPYFALGGGVRHVSVEAVAGPEVESGTDPMGTLAAGVRLEALPGLWLKVEVRDFASFYESPSTGESRFQNDIAITLGIGT